MATGSPLMHLVTNGRFRCSRGHELVLNRDPSLLCLPSQGRSLLVLPGDGMFQAQRVVNGKCRPVILHGYGGAKKEMPTSLATLAKFGWIPMATAMAMVGSASSPPLRAGNDWRPILGTLVDTRILPPPLSAKESLLLLSQWIRLPRNDLHIMHATNSWLQPGKVNFALGPDCDDSPHSVRVLPLDLGIAPYLAMLFGPQKADQGHPSKTVKQDRRRAKAQAFVQLCFCKRQRKRKKTYAFISGWVRCFSGGEAGPGSFSASCCL